MRRQMREYRRRHIAAAVEGLWMGILLAAVPGIAQAACVAGGGPNTYTCTDTTDLAASQTGETTLDATSNPVTLNLNPGGVLLNDVATVTTGTHATVLATGGAAITLINAGSPPDFAVFPPVGALNMDRSAAVFDLAGWSADPNGVLLNGGAPVGVAAALYATSGSGPLLYRGLDSVAYATGDFSAIAFGNASRQTYELLGNSALNITSGMMHQSHSGTVGDTLAEGHWAIANYAGATFTAPAVLDGTQYATNVTPGLTTLRLDAMGWINGDILVVDRNPLLMAAERLDPTLVLAYGAAEAGPRDSLIELHGDPLSYGGATVNGNFYFGSGEHTFINRFGNVQGNFYVDQRDTTIVDVAGGVATPQYLVSGARKFTMTMDGNWNGNLEIQDVLGAVNTVNIIGTSYSNFIALNGVGTNTLNFYCGRSYNRPSCDTAADIAGFTTLNLFGEGTDSFLRSNGGGIQVIGDINVFNTRLYATEALNAANVNIRAGSTLTMNGAPVDINANLNVAGGIHLTDQTMHVTGDLSLASGAVLRTTISGSGHGNLVVDGTGTIDAGAQVIPSVQNAVVRNGDTYTLATHTSGAPTIVNRGLIRWTLGDVGGDLVLTASTNAAVTLPGLTTGAVNALNTIGQYAGPNVAFTTLAGTLQNLTTDEVMAAGERLRPEIHDGVLRLALGMTDRVQGLVASRLFDAHLAAAYGLTGLASGDASSVGASLWMQGFGFGGDQSRRAGVDGYTAEATGLAFGADRLVGEDGRMRLGAALGYARGDVNNQGATDTSQLTLNHYLAMLYASRSEEDWYLNGMLGFGRQNYRGTRIPLSGMNTIGHRDGVQLTARMEAGMPLHYGEDLTFIPVATVSYNRLREDRYQETGSLVALEVGARNTDSLRSGLGGKAIYTVQETDWRADLELRTMWGHEFGDVRQDVTARFLAGGPAFFSPGVNPARDDFNVGGSLRLTGANEQDEISLLLSYDADFRARYFGQSLSMMLRYDFDQAEVYTRQAELRQTAAARKTPSRAVTLRDQEVTEFARAMAPGDAAETAVSATLEAWARARAEQDVERYLRHYTPDFSSPETGSHSAWERKRKAQLSQEGRLTVNIAHLKVQVAGEDASAVFTQTLTGAGRQEVSRKIVDLVARDGRWLIVGENDLAVTE